MIAKALSENKDLKLTHFSAGRDRLENKGITALAEVFGAMGSLEEVNVPQNGIKDAGMTALISNLTAGCSGSLRELRVNDNWLKTEATEKLLQLFLKSEALKVVNISDSNMGTINVIVALRALKSNANVKLTSFHCNYNDVEHKDLGSECLDILAALEGIEFVEFVGNI